MPFDPHTKRKIPNKYKEDSERSGFRTSIRKAKNAKHEGRTHMSFLAIRRQEGKGLEGRVKSKHRLSFRYLYRRATGDTYWALFLPGFLKSLRDSLKASIALHTQEAKKEQLTSKRPHERLYIFTLFLVSFLFPWSSKQILPMNSQCLLLAQWSQEAGGIYFIWL